MTSVSTPPGSGRRRPLGYLVGRYPAVSHTFITREIEALRRLGWTIHSFSIWKTNPEHLLTEQDWSERKRTYALLPPSPLRLLHFLRAHLRAASRPRAYLNALRTAVGMGSGGPRKRLLSISWFLEAILIFDRCRSQGIEHLHVHLGGTATMVALVAAQFARDTGAKLGWSMTVHGPHEFYAVEQEQLRRKVEEASFVICISDFARSQLMAHSTEDHWQKLRVVRCGIDLDTFAAGRSRSSSTNPTDDTCRILTVGRLDPLKGQGVLLSATSELLKRGRNVSLTIIGGGDRRPVLEEMANELGLGSVTTWAGAVGQDRIRDFYAAADIFCLPSFAEGIPIVLMEAMAMEIPVVSCRITGIPELITSRDEGLLVRPGRVDELADALDLLCGDSELRSSMGERGRDAVDREYRIDQSAAALSRIFEGNSP